MNNFRYQSTIVLLSLILVWCPAVSAEEPVDQCSDLAKECFAQTDVQRSNCLFSAATHPFCDGTRLGKLIYRRWAMSPVRPLGQEQPPAFLGPKLIDGQCLQNFDNRFLALLLDEEKSLDFSNLQDELNKCTREVSNELTRP